MPSALWPAALGLSLVVSAMPIAADDPVSFAADLMPTLKARCAVCHMTGGEPGGMALTPDTAWSDLVGRDSMGLPSMKRVNPGEPQSSYLMHKLWGSHREVGGNGSRMPLHQPPLSAAVLGDFETWIQAGAANN